MTAQTSFIPTVVATLQASSYRVKFLRAKFLELVDYAKPKTIYKRGKYHFFAYDGFVMYCQQCNDEDFPDQKLIEAIEFSNEPWAT